MSTSFSPGFPPEIFSQILCYHRPFLCITIEDGYAGALDQFQEETRFASNLCLVNLTFYGIMTPLLYSTFLVFIKQDDLTSKLPAVKANHRWITRFALLGVHGLRLQVEDSFTGHEVGEMLSLCEKLKPLELYDFHFVFPYLSDDATALAPNIFSSICSPNLTSLSLLSRDASERDFDENPAFMLCCLPKVVAGRLRRLVIEGWDELGQLYSTFEHPFSSLCCLEFNHLDLDDDYFLELMQALTRLPSSRNSDDSTSSDDESALEDAGNHNTTIASTESTPPIRIIDLRDVSARVANTFVTNILRLNNLGLGLQYLYIKILDRAEYEELDVAPSLICEQCPNLEYFIYLVPSPVTFLSGLPVGLKELGVLLSREGSTGFDGVGDTPLLYLDLLLDWLNDREKRRAVRSLIVSWAWEVHILRRLVDIRILDKVTDVKITYYDL